MVIFHSYVNVYQKVKLIILMVIELRKLVMQPGATGDFSVEKLVI